MNTLLSIIIVITSIIIIVAVAMMESEQAGLGTLDGSVESLWGKNKGSGKKEILNRTTIVASIIFAIALVVMSAI
ncbi:preprotein translocase subunit SecG [Peptoniphilus sp. GNH]|nr:preprotein translocase subunit SecG [Peptoniphilus sp. GNH]